MLLKTIEDIVLANDTRGIASLRPFMPQDFVSDAARYVLAHPGTVLIVTGFHILHANAPETDGPPGAAALGGALKALGYTVVYVTDQFSSAVVKAVARNGEVVEFPMVGHEESEAVAAGLITQYSPSLLIAVERAGLVGDGTYRNCRGADFSPWNAKTDYLFSQHPASVGIGDGGNEVGMGNLRDAIQSLEGLPQDPCVTKTGRLIIASASNWGAYGFIAALSRLTNRHLLPSIEQGHQWVVDAVAAGAVDGLTGERKDWVDGRSPDEDAVCLRDLHTLVARGRLDASR